jgi:uncharacterized membrane protein (DUF2068 family)
VTPWPGHAPIGFKIIGVYKLVTAVISLALGIELSRLFRSDIGPTLDFLIRFLRLDPENALIHWVIERLMRIDHKQLRLLQVGMFAYAALHTIEGIGILRGKRWGGVLIIMATSSLIPVELYEIWKHTRPLRIAALVLNLAIVIYLFVHRRELSRWGQASGDEGQAQRSTEVAS